MISGTVNADHEAIVPLELRGPTGATLSIDAVIDTGFSDYLTLPVAVIAQLSLPYRETARFTLADGTQASLDVFRADVHWDGHWRGALATAADGGPLAGMALLQGHELRVQVTNGGVVTVERLA